MARLITVTVPTLSCVADTWYKLEISRKFAKQASSKLKLAVMRLHKFLLPILLTKSID